jgi:putative selenium metabolism protein SsnA
VNWLLEGGLLVDPSRRSVHEGALAITDGRIVRDAAEDAERLDVSGCVVMPGQVCAHHHLYSALARGMPGPAEPPRAFPEILERIWWRLDRALDAETIHLSALLGSVEAARAGTTTIIDHHASPETIGGSLDLVALGLDEAGLRGVVCYEVTDRHGVARARDGIAENVRFLGENSRPRIRGMMGAHASFTIGPETMEALVAEARRMRAAVHIHLAEDDIDERDALEHYGMRTVHRLAQAGALTEGALVAHGVHLDASEQQTLRESGAWLAHNPRSNMNNGVGYAPVRGLGDRVALGTDGIDGDLFAEARICYLKAREASSEVGPSFALERVVAGARLVAGLLGEPLLGTFVEGAPADLIVLEYAPPTPLDAGNLAGHLVFGMQAGHVRDVMVAGRWIVRNRRHELVDEADLVARCREAAPQLWSRMQAF